MSSYNYLDKTGLGEVWSKIKSKFYTKTEVDAMIPTCTTLDEIEEMCDALNLSAEVVNVDDYEIQEQG